MADFDALSDWCELEKEHADIKLRNEIMPAAWRDLNNTHRLCDFCSHLPFDLIYEHAKACFDELWPKCSRWYPQWPPLYEKEAFSIRLMTSRGHISNALKGCHFCAQIVYSLYADDQVFVFTVRRWKESSGVDVSTDFKRFKESHADPPMPLKDVKYLDEVLTATVGAKDDYELSVSEYRLSAWLKVGGMDIRIAFGPRRHVLDDIARQTKALPSTTIDLSTMRPCSARTGEYAVIVCGSQPVKVDLQSLPDTTNEVIDLARQLGFQHAYLDCLKDDASDQELVYRNASLTLVAGKQQRMSNLIDLPFHVSGMWFYVGGARDYKTDPISLYKELFSEQIFFVGPGVWRSTYSASVDRPWREPRKGWPKIEGEDWEKRDAWISLAKRAHGDMMPIARRFSREAEWPMEDYAHGLWRQDMPHALIWWYEESEEADDLGYGQQGDEEEAGIAKEITEAATEADLDSNHAGWVLLHEGDARPSWSWLNRGPVEFWEPRRGGCVMGGPTGPWYEYELLEFGEDRIVLEGHLDDFSVLETTRHGAVQWDDGPRPCSIIWAIPGTGLMIEQVDDVWRRVGICRSTKRVDRRLLIDQELNIQRVVLV